MKYVLYGTMGCLAAAVAWLGWDQYQLKERLEALRAGRYSLLGATGKDNATAASMEDLKARFERTRIDLSAALQGIAQTSSKVDALQQAVENLNRHVQTTLAQRPVKAEPHPPPAPAKPPEPTPLPIQLAKTSLEPVPLPLAQPAPAPAPVKRPSQRRRWGPEQATGAPDTVEAGDLSTAWAPLAPNTGTQWLLLEYEKPVNLAEVRVRETFNPGAVCKVSAITPEGQEVKVWEGKEPETQAPSEISFPVTTNVSSRSVKVYLDTRRVAGWNEIDAVELVGTDGTRQWAVSASASSSYADR